MLNISSLLLSLVLLIIVCCPILASFIPQVCYSLLGTAESGQAGEGGQHSSQSQVRGHMLSRART